MLLLSLQPIFVCWLLVKILSVHYAYNSPSADVSIEIPVGDRLVQYRVEVIPLAFGLEAYGLAPIDPRHGHSILLFRGTAWQPAAKASGLTMLADLGLPRGGLYALPVSVFLTSCVGWPDNETEKARCRPGSLDIAWVAP